MNTTAMPNSLSSQSSSADLPEYKFKAVDDAAWRASAEKLLKGAPFDKLVTTTIEGLKIQPLYTLSSRDAAAEQRQGLPGVAPYVRGNTPADQQQGWLICQLYTSFDAGMVNAEMRRDFGRGLQAAWLRLDKSIRTGAGPAAVSASTVDGVGLYTHKDLAIALDGLELNKHSLFLDAGAVTPLLAGSLLKITGLKPKDLLGILCNDPLGALAVDGVIPFSLETAYDLLAATVTKFKTAPRLATVLVSGEPAHNAGADLADEIAIMLATTVEYLRALEARGIAPKLAAAKFAAFVPIGRETFRELAKLRALRGLWVYLLKHCGINKPPPLCINAVASARTLSQRDPWVNMLRVTAETFAGGLGGADIVTTRSFDAALTTPSEFGRRMAINTQLILQAESHLAMVSDSAGGSYYLEAITRELAALAWQRFQELEAAGGIATMLLDGRLAARLAKTAALRHKDIAKRKTAVVGVSVSPHIAEQNVPIVDQNSAITNLQKRFKPKPAAKPPHAKNFAALKAAADKADFASLAASWGGAQTAPALPLLREAAPFENLRDRADAHSAKAGKRPTIFLANLGKIAEHKARSTFAKNFYEAGGIATSDNDGFSDVTCLSQAFNQSSAAVAVLCSSDEVYARLAIDAAKALKAAGAKQVALAGRPGDNEAVWRAAGIDTFIYTGCDVLAELEKTLSVLGVV